MPRPKPAGNPDQDRRMYELQTQGVSYKEISRIEKVPYWKVNDALCRHRLRERTLELRKMPANPPTNISKKYLAWEFSYYG